jgi:integrase
MKVQRGEHTEVEKRVSSAQADPEGESLAKGGLSKTHRDYWSKRIFKPTYARGGATIEARNWAVEIQHRGKRHRWSLGTPNKGAAADRARSIYLSIAANGWNEAFAEYRPEMAVKKPNVTVGDFLAEVRATADVSLNTIEDYSRAFRKIIADIIGLDDNPKKFDYRTGGYQAWLEKVQGVKLTWITPQRVQVWKRAFLAKAAPDPLSQRQAKVNVNSFLRRARSLFSAKITRHLMVELPDPLPFSDVAFEPRQSLKYRSGFDVQKLITKAQDELAEADPECFKIFLLAVMVGLRRHEIDLLEWDSFHWEASVIRIEPTEYFLPKSEDSIGDVQVDQELMEIFRGYRARRPRDRFVIMASGVPKPRVVYVHYRAQKCFERLTAWLRKQGVKGNKPLHVLRKEFGSQICAVHGIHAASEALRHADIGITAQFYADARKRATSGFGHLLSGPNEKVVEIRASKEQAPAAASKS